MRPLVAHGVKHPEVISSCLFDLNVQMLATAELEHFRLSEVLQRTDRMSVRTNYIARKPILVF